MGKPLVGYPSLPIVMKMKIPNMIKPINLLFQLCKTTS